MAEIRESNPLRVEDQLVFDILGRLNQVPLSQRESILATVASFVIAEQDAYEEEMKRKVISKLTGMGCRVEEQSHDWDEPQWGSDSGQ